LSLYKAGFAGVVASLWSVADLSTALLMEQFYTLWRVQKMAPALALTGSQRWLRDLKAADLAERFNAERHKSATGQGMVYEEASRAWRTFAGMPCTVRPFDHPFYWGAFLFAGV
jgi:CHAT domain-containing protein